MSNFFDQYQVDYVVNYLDAEYRLPLLRNDTAFQILEQSWEVVASMAAVDPGDCGEAFADTVMAALAPALGVAGFMSEDMMDRMILCCGTNDMELDFFQVFVEISRGDTVLFRGPEAIGQLVQIDGVDAINCHIAAMTPQPPDDIDPDSSEGRDWFRRWFPSNDELESRFADMSDEARNLASKFSLVMTSVLGQYINTLSS